MNIAVIGANGQLGSDVCEEFKINGDEVIELNHDDIEITDRESVFKVISSLKPDIIVNTAAYHNVEKCETEYQQAFLGNAWGAKNLAKVTAELDIFLIHISTDYVFDGAKKAPYIETDLPLPLSVYANTKLSGEYFVQTNAKRYLVMRSSGLYGKNPCRAKGGNNFVDLMLKLATTRDEVRVVDNEVLTPTSTKELSRQIVKASRMDAYGLCHATAEGLCSWYEFAKEIFKIMEMDVNLNIAAPGEFPTKVRRPSYSVLENKFLKDHGINIFKHWKEGLEEYLKKERVSEHK